MRVYSRDAPDRDGFAGFASGSWEVVRLRHHVPTILHLCRTTPHLT